VRDYEKSRAFSLFSPFSATNWHPPGLIIQSPDHALHVSFLCRHYNHVIEDDHAPAGRGQRQQRNASRCENDLWSLKLPCRAMTKIIFAGELLEVLFSAFLQCAPRRLIPMISTIWSICDGQQSTQRDWSWFSSHFHSLTFESHFFKWSHRDLVVAIWYWDWKLKTHLSSEDITYPPPSRRMFFRHSSRYWTTIIHFKPTPLRRETIFAGFFRRAHGIADRWRLFSVMWILFTYCIWTRLRVIAAWCQAILCEWLDFISPSWFCWICQWNLLLWIGFFCLGSIWTRFTIIATWIPCILSELLENTSFFRFRWTHQWMVLFQCKSLASITIEPAHNYRAWTLRPLHLPPIPSNLIQSQPTNTHSAQKIAGSLDVPFCSMKHIPNGIHTVQTRCIFWNMQIWNIPTYKHGTMALWKSEI
jgi:hypothetical protein